MFTLALSPSPSPSFAHACFPPIPSPLGPLNPNVRRPQIAFPSNMSAKEGRRSSTFDLLKKPGAFESSRTHQRALLSRRDPQKERDRRRFQFLEKVKERREGRKNEERTEKLERLDVLDERKEWERRQEVEAQRWSLGLDGQMEEDVDKD